MTKLRCVFCALTASALFLLASGIARADELKLTIADGKVTLDADNVPLRAILAEWTRVGETQIVNAEKLTGAPITVHLANVPEAQALDIVLRSASGYMAAPRPAGAAGASRYDRVIILASSRPTVTGPPPAFTNQQQPRFQPPPPMVPQPGDEADDDQEPSEEAPPTAMPGFAPQPGAMMPGQVAPNAPGFQPATPATVQMPVPPGQVPPGQVTAPITSSRPGLLPVPAQQQQPPQQPPPPAKPNRPIPN
jgi:hypothetical protein